MDIDLRALKDTYLEYVEIQNERVEIGDNKFYQKMALAIYEATVRALDPDIADMQIVSAQTGSGKSTYMEAMAAALYKHNLSCSILTKTTNQTDITYRNIAKLVGQPTGYDVRQNVINQLRGSNYVPKIVVPYSAIHKVSSTAYIENQNFELDPLEHFKRHDKQVAPIVVSTHAALMVELEIDDDTGILKRDDVDRNVIFLDESPDFVVSGIMRKGVIEQLKDDLHGAQFKKEYNAITKLQEEFQQAIEDKSNTVNAQFTTNVNLFNENLDKVFLERHSNYYKEKGKKLPMMEHLDRKGKKQLYTDFIKFLKALKHGEHFISKNEGHITYTHNLFVNNPSFVMLDATAIIEDFQELNQLDVDSIIPCPTVSYENLQIYHIQPPNEFTGSRTANKSNSYIVSYKDYIMKLLLENSEPGEEILLVARKHVVERIYKDELINAYVPFEPEDRLVHVIYFGNFIGENEWEDIEKVFIISGYQRPFDIYKGLEGIYSGGINEEQLALQSGSNLVKLAKNIRENESLKWFKQLSARGNIRNVTNIGKAGNMELYTDVELLWLIKNQRRAYPHSPNIEFLISKNDGKAKTRNKIVRYLAANKEGICDYDDLAKAAGFSSRNQISRVLKNPEVSQGLTYLGWKIVNKRDVPDFEGKGLKRLVNYSIYKSTSL